MYLAAIRTAQHAARPRNAAVTQDGTFPRSLCCLWALMEMVNWLYCEQLPILRKLGRFNHRS